MKKLTKTLTYILHSYFVTFLILLFNPSTLKFERDNLSNAAMYYSFFTFLPLIFHLYCCNVVFEIEKQWFKRLKIIIPFSVIYFGIIFKISELNFISIAYFLATLFSTLLASLYKFYEEKHFNSNEEKLD